MKIIFGLFLFSALFPIGLYAADSSGSSFSDKQIVKLAVYNNWKLVSGNSIPENNSLKIWAEVVDENKILRMTAKVDFGLVRDPLTLDLPLWRAKSNWFGADLGKVDAGTHFGFSVCAIYLDIYGKEVQECAKSPTNYLVNVASKQILEVSMYDGISKVGASDTAPSNNLILWARVADKKKIKRAEAFTRVEGNKKVNVATMITRPQDNWLRVVLGKVAPSTKMRFGLCVTYDAGDGEERKECYENNENNLVTIAPSHIKKVHLYEGKGWVPHRTVRTDSKGLILWVEVLDRSLVKWVRARVKIGPETKTVELAGNAKNNWYSVALADFNPAEQSLSYEVGVSSRLSQESDKEFEEWSTNSGKGFDVFVVPKLQDFHLDSMNFEGLEGAKSVKVGLANIGSSCYLNGIVALAANFPVFDTSLAANLNLFKENRANQTEMKAAYFAGLIHLLRTQPEGLLPLSSDVLRPYAYYLGHRGAQRDSIEDVLVDLGIGIDQKMVLVSTTKRNYDVELKVEERTILAEEIISQNRTELPWLSIRPEQDVNQVSDLFALQYFAGTEDQDGGFVTKRFTSFSHSGDVAPQYVLIKVERFNGIWNYMTQKLEVSKVKDKILLESELDIPMNDYEDSRYELVGTLNHRGEKIESGHYYSHILHDDGWRKHDDGSVQPTRFETIQDDSTSVMLFYRKKAN